MGWTIGVLGLDCPSMIRRDYILRMIEEFFRTLAKLKEQKEQQQWEEAELTLEEEAKRLTGLDIEMLITLSDTELMARLLQMGEIHAHRERSLMLARVLIEWAGVREAEGGEAEAETARLIRLKALHLMLHTAMRSEGWEWPEFVPAIDIVSERLGREALPLQTHGLLMQHFERSEQFAKAEDSLFAAQDLAPFSPELRQIGISFYQRLLAKADAALERGNLPRPEVEAGLDEWLKTALSDGGR